MHGLYLFSTLWVPRAGHAVGAVRSPKAAAVLQHHLRSLREAAEAAKPVTEHGDIKGKRLGSPLLGEMYEHISYFSPR